MARPWRLRDLRRSRRGSPWGWLLAGFTAGGALALFRRRRPVLAPEEALLRLGGGAEVLGAFLHGEARAYPIGSFAFRPLLRDRIGDRMVEVAYHPPTQAALLDQSASLHAELAARGPVALLRPGREERVAPLVRTTLQSWLALHPRSHVLARGGAWRERLLDRRSYGEAARRQAVGDPRLPAEVEVLGVARQGQAIALTRERLRQVAPLELSLGGAPVVIFYDPQRDIAAAYFRYAGERPHSFRASDEEPGAVARDVETGSFWDVAGRCLRGHLAGYALSPVPLAMDRVRWWAWSIAYPQTRANDEAEQLPAYPEPSPGL
jgi:hypothetical protein